MKWTTQLRISGEPQEIDMGFTRLESCCDCGLTHLVLYEMENKKVFKITYRDDWLTDKARKRNKVVVYKRRERSE